MARKKNASAPKSCRDCEHWEKLREKIRVAELLEKVIGSIEKQLEESNLKATTAEYLKLIQLQKEFEQNEAKEIRVRWVEPGQSEEETGS